MPEKSVVRQYLDNGCRLTPLNGKKPILKNWTTREVKPERLFSHKGNLAWVLDQGDLVIDVDADRGGPESFERLLQDNGLDADSVRPTVYTPGGGYHVYTRVPDDFRNERLRRDHPDYPGIDFLGKGQKCTIATSRTREGSYDPLDSERPFCRIETPLPIVFLLKDTLIEIGSKAETRPREVRVEDTPRTSGEDDFARLVAEHDTGGWTEEKVRNHLDKLNPSMGNDPWVKVGMALHDWNPKRGLDLWEEWSQAGSNYTPGETAKRWRSFSAGKTTLGTLDWMTKAVDYDKETSMVRKILKAITKVRDQKTIELSLIPKIKTVELSKINFERVAVALQKRLRELTGVKTPINHVRAMLGHGEVVSGTFVEDGEIPEWCLEWLFLNVPGEFFNLETFRRHKPPSFNNLCGKMVPASKGGAKVNATKFVNDWGFVRQVENAVYRPDLAERYFTETKATFVNSFNPDSVPKAAKSFTKAGLEAIKAIQKHVAFICTNANDSEIMTQWLAHQIQHPGRRILWAPVVQSIEGTGKTFIGEILAWTLGDENVGKVIIDENRSTFTSWATGHCVNILEELRIAGHNRHDVANTLKPLITDRRIQVHPKKVDPYLVTNVTNYLCFTNFRDALPLDHQSRRWWIIFMPIKDLSELPRYVGMESTAYFEMLHTGLRSHYREIRKWLLEYPISESFLEMKQAPTTPHKLAMISTEDSAMEGLEEVREAIIAGGTYYNSEVVSSADLFAAVTMTHPELELDNFKRRQILKKLDFVKLPRTVRIEGDVKRFWVSRTDMTNDEIRDILHKRRPQNLLENDPVML